MAGQKALHAGVRLSLVSHLCEFYLLLFAFALKKKKEVQLEEFVHMGDFTAVERLTVQNVTLLAAD